MSVLLLLAPGSALLAWTVFYIYKAIRPAPQSKQGFTVEGVHTTDMHCNGLMIFRQRRKWRRFVDNLELYPNHYAGKGIVICAGGLSYFTCAWINIHILRSRGCDLPIEIWHQDGELNAEVEHELSRLNVVCKNYRHYTSIRITQGYQLKPLAILYSSFREVLYLDADNVCIKDPTYLFDDPHYQSGGTVFWPDFWTTSALNPIWKIVGSTASREPEQESGQLLIDKEKCWAELNLAGHFNLDPFYYRILWGDKDTFRFAWTALRTPFYMIPTGVGGVGFKDGRFGFCAVAMIQHDGHGRHLFVHNNLFKWDGRATDQHLWRLVRKLEPDGSRQLRMKYHPVLERFFLEIGGDVIDSTDDTIAWLEVESLQILKHLRTEKFYQDFTAAMNRPRVHTHAQ